MEKFIFNTLKGNIEISMTEDTIYSLSFTNKNITKVPKHCKWVVKKINNYFKGKDDLKNIKVNLEGTDFQVKAWKALMNIPYGLTASYKQQAILVGNKKAVRAIGNANSKNKIALIVP